MLLRLDSRSQWLARQDALVNLLTNGIPVELATGQATANMFEEAAITNPGGTD